MKKLFKIVKKAALALGLAGSLATASAQTSIPLTSYPLTNATTFKVANGAAIVTTLGASNINSQPFQIWRGRGFSFNAGFYGTNSGTANVNMTLRFAARHTVNGVTYTNWITAGPRPFHSTPR
jgi:hypothetical protein